MELGRVVPVIGLTVLLAADAVLIGWALRPVPTEVFAPATSSASASPTTSPSTAAAAVKTAPVEQFVTAVGPRIAWVVRAGTCTDPGGLWVTKDAGSSWTSSDLPGRLLRLRPDSASAAFGAGGDAECSLKLWNTGDAGSTWKSGAQPDRTWSRVPDDDRAVHTATDQVVRPCGTRAVIDLVVLDADRASVLCPNGDVRSTTDGGGEWADAFTRSRSLALTVNEAGTGVLVRADPECAGIVAVPISGGEPAEEGECVVAPAATGKVSVSSVPGAWWLVAGTAVFTAEDPEGPWARTAEDLG